MSRSFSPAGPRPARVRLRNLALGLAAGLATGHAGAADNALTADQLVAEVLSANPGLASLEAAVREAGARVAPAGSLDEPQLTYKAAPATFGGRTDDGHVVQLSQAIPWPGKLTLRSEAAERRTDAAAQRLEAARLQVAALTRAVYAEWHFVHRALAVNARGQALLEDLKASAETLYAAGRVPQQDVLRAERERTHLIHQETVHERERRSVRAQINALLGRSPEHPLPPAGDLVAPKALPSAERLRAAAVHQHPELDRLQARVAASEAEVKLARKGFYPDFEVTTGYNSLWGERDKRWTVGVRINLPLDRGRLRAELAGAKAGRKRAEWALADRRAKLLADVETARAEAAESRRTVELYDERLVPLARATLDAAMADYEAGNGDFLEVIDAERELLRAELQRSRARADYARRRAKLERWVGGELPPGSAPAAVNKLEYTHE